MEQQVSKDSRLHERTVQQASRHADVFAAKRTRGGRKPKTHVTEIIVDRMVWAKATDLASHPSHIEIISATSVVVHNNARWRKRPRSK
jgi:hypothetical protein